MIRKLLQSPLSTRLTLLDQIMVSGSNFLIGILLTRWLGLEEYGVFALAWLGLQLASGLQLNFVLKPMMSLAPKMEAAARRQYLAETQSLNLLITLLLTLFGLLVIGLGDVFFPAQSLDTLFPILPLAIMAFLFQDYYRRLFFIRGTIWLALCLDGIAYLGMIGGVGATYLWGELRVSVAYGIIFICFLAAGLLGYIWAGRSGWKGQALPGLLQKHWRFSSWLVGTTLLQFFGSNFFLVAAGALLGSAAVGALRIAQNLMGLTHVLFQAMENVVPIKAAQALQQDGVKGMIRYLKLITAKSGFLIGLILLAVALAAAPLISLVYGDEFIQYDYLLIGYCGFYAILFPGYPLRYALRSVEYTQPIFWAYVLSAGFSLAAAYPMVRQWELMGVVYGLIITQVIMQACYVLMLRRRLTAVSRTGTFL